MVMESSTSQALRHARSTALERSLLATAAKTRRRRERKLEGGLNFVHEPIVRLLERVGRGSAHGGFPLLASAVATVFLAGQRR
jgi:hypothetical protein